MQPQADQVTLESASLPLKTRVVVSLLLCGVYGGKQIFCVCYKLSAPTKSLNCRWWCLCLQNRYKFQFVTFLLELNHEDCPPPPSLYRVKCAERDIVKSNANIIGLFEIRRSNTFLLTFPSRHKYTRFHPHNCPSPPHLSSVVFGCCCRRLFEEEWGRVPLVGSGDVNNFYSIGIPNWFFTRVVS